MSAKSKKKPTPEELLAEVKGKESAKTYEFWDYIEVVDELVKKDYSYAKIAEFLADKLGIEINRGQVYRAYQMWLAEQQRVEEEARHAEEYEHERADKGAEPDFVQQMNAFRREAADEILQRLKEKFREELNQFPVTSEDILRTALQTIEESRRDDAEAEEADRKKEVEKGAK